MLSLHQFGKTSCSETCVKLELPPALIEKPDSEKWSTVRLPHNFHGLNITTSSHKNNSLVAALAWRYSVYTSKIQIS